MKKYTILSKSTGTLLFQDDGKKTALFDSYEIAKEKADAFFSSPEYYQIVPIFF